GNACWTQVVPTRPYRCWWANLVVLCCQRDRLVGERGFEPPTPWSRTRCSTRLSHSPTSPERNEHPRQTVEKRAVTTHSVVIITFALLRPSCEVECAALVDSVHDASTV